MDAEEQHHMGNINDYRANEKNKKRKYPKIRASFSDWKRGRPLRIPIIAVAIFVFLAAVRLQQMDRPSKTLFTLSILLLLAWYVLKVVNARTAYVNIKARKDEIVQISEKDIVYAYRTRMDASALGQEIMVMLTMQKGDVKGIIEKTKPRRLELTGMIHHQTCSPDQFLNRQNPSVKIKKGTRAEDTIVLYDYYNRSDAMFAEIKQFIE